MYIIDGVAYAGEIKPSLKVVGVRALNDFGLWVRFNNGESKMFDFKQMLDFPAYAPLSDIEIFKGVYIDYGVPAWNNGEIDIAPEYLYENGIPAENSVSQAQGA